MEINVAGLMPIGKKFHPAIRIFKDDRRTDVGTAKSDNVDLSNFSKDISRIKYLIDSVSDVRESRVVEVRFSIESGTYNVSSEQIAEKIMGGDLLG